MEYITFKEASEKFGVSLKTISNWVKFGKLDSGPNFGRAKTVTVDSVNKKLEDPAFMRGVNIARGNRIITTGNVANGAILEKLDYLCNKIDKIENTLSHLGLSINDLPGVTDSTKKVIELQESSGKKKTTKKAPKRLVATSSNTDIEAKAKFILEVHKQAQEFFPKNRNPFSSRKIDQSGGNLPSVLKKGKRPKERIIQTYETILEINGKEQIFSNLSINNIVLSQS